MAQTFSEYTPADVWEWNTENGGQFANINRPIAGATHDKERPVGKHPMQLYSLATPNGVKVTVMLEELLALGHQGAEYDAWLVNIRDGNQFSSGFVDANPNSKIPALFDHSTPTPTRVFESGSILLYLAEKFGAFLPTEHHARTETINWLMWQMGSAPYLGGATPCATDLAVMPFVRQFAAVDPVWFARQNLPSVRAWLDGWLVSPLFVTCMVKLPVQGVNRFPSL